MYITYHAKKRCKERCNLPASALERNAKKALIYGLPVEKLNKKLYSRYHSSLGRANKEIIYNRYVYCFLQGTLLTVYPLDKCDWELCDKLQKNNKENAL